MGSRSGKASARFRVFWSGVIISAIARPEPPLFAPAARSSHGRTVEASAGFDTDGRDLPASLAFLVPAGVDPSVLHEVARRAARLRVAPAVALVASGAMTEAAYLAALGRHMGLLLLDREPAIAHWQSRPEAKAPGFARLEDPRGTEKWVLAPRLDQIDLLLGGWRRPARRDGRISLAAAPDFEAWYLAANGGACAAAAATHLQRLHPGFSAGDRPRPRWRWPALGLVVLCGAALPGSADALRFGIGLVAGLLFAAASLVRLLAATASEGPPRATPRPLADGDLPTYTVLVPLLHEAVVLPQLIAALSALDYPPEKLDVRLLVEVDDAETRAAIARLPLPAHIRTLVVPPGQPRGKPRALQVALPFARGDLVTVFDAEDVPEPGQLRRAAAAFARAPADVACLQASLVIDNARDGWLTATFALEYAALFDAVDPGLDALGWPILLGGTSNHFRTAVLREVGGWDPWNVTEDADLGLRLARFGYRVGTLASTTDEEAPGRLAGWLGQRRRWLKGWMQTLATHGRAPRRLYAELGPVRATVAAVTLLGGVLGPLLGPLFLLETILDLASGRLLAPVGPGEVITSTLSCFVLVIGPAALLWPAWMGIRRRRPPHAMRGLLFLPAYLALTSLAAWGALWDLWRAPFHWRKTGHGLALTSVRRPGAGAGSRRATTRPRLPSRPVRRAPPNWLFRRP